MACHTTAIKLAEVAQALKDGGEELDAVVNISKVRSRDWQYVSDELNALAEATHAGGAKIKVIFENAYLDDAAKIRLCEICAEMGADWVKTSTGYAPRRSHPCRSGTDAQVFAAAGAGEGGGRSARSGYGAGHARDRREPRGHAEHRSHSGGVPQTAGVGAYCARAQLRRSLADIKSACSNCRTLRGNE